MTAIAGLMADDGKVWIGGDSAGIAGFSRTVRSDVKVFTNAGYIFGFTDSFRMGQLIRCAWVPPQPANNEDVYEFLVTRFIDELRTMLKAGGYAEVHNNVETGGSFLMGFRGQLYSVESDFQVGIPAIGYAAMGCGDDLVLGSLHTSAYGNLSPRTRITRALDAASAFSAGVCPPYTILAR